MTTTTIIGDHHGPMARHCPKSSTALILGRLTRNPGSWIYYLHPTPVETAAWLDFNLSEITWLLQQNEIPGHVP